jgi:nucleoside-diphosphate-sugar epimerase
MPMKAPPPSRPAAFKRARLLIVGCGDVGLRVARQAPHWRRFALTSDAARAPALRAAGLTPIVGNLDAPATLRRLAALAPLVLHLAPPPSSGRDDPRTRALLQALSRSAVVQRLVYASTTGVYGDAAGARFDETRAVNPGNERAHRRVSAEQAVRRFGRHRTASLLRIPGIYGRDREGGHPRERLARGTPVLAADDDVYTNHIQADDLARVCMAALLHGRPQRVYHASDDTELKMGDYFDLAADLCGLPRPERVPRAAAAHRMSPLQLSFMSESRRLVNRRMKDELRVVLRYPTVRDGL